MTVDSRLKGHHGSVTHPTLPLERTYCAHCGKPKGWVSTESSAFIASSSVIAICDDCAARLGPLPLEEVKIDEFPT